MKTIVIGYQLLRKYCKYYEERNICCHDKNPKRDCNYSCCYTYCPVVAEEQTENYCK